MRGIYLTAATTLALLALITMFWSVFEVYRHILTNPSIEEESISVMLRSVGAIIISVAILDVAKYMIEEEVFRYKELRSSKEARETLNKILVIVTIAVSIEGLIYIFKAGAEDVSFLVYPAFLIITAVILIIGLGFYQLLSIKAEQLGKEQ